MPPLAQLDHPLPDRLLDLIAERFRVLGEPMRIKLLDQLRAGPLTVGELTEATGTTQQNASKHLGMLARAGLVGRQKEGTRVHYFIADPSVFQLCELVCDGMRDRVAELDALLKTEAP